MFKKGQQLIYLDGGILVEVVFVSDSGEGEYMTVRELDEDNEFIVTREEYYKYKATTCCSCGKQLEDYQTQNYCKGDVCMLGILIG